MKFFIVLFAVAIASTLAAPQDATSAATDAVSSATSNGDITGLLSGLNLQGILNDLPDTLQATLKEVGEGVKKLLSGDPDVALNDVVKGVKEVTSTIRDNSKALTPVANLIDQLADKAVANPEDTAAVQNLARPILQLLNLTQGSSLSDLSGSIDDLLSGGGLGGLLGGVTGGK